MSGTRSGKLSKSLINYSFPLANAHGGEALFKEVYLFWTANISREKIKDAPGKMLDTVLLRNIDERGSVCSTLLGYDSLTMTAYIYNWRRDRRMCCAETPQENGERFDLVGGSKREPVIPRTDQGKASLK